MSASPSSTNLRDGFARLGVHSLATFPLAREARRRRLPSSEDRAWPSGSRRSLIFGVTECCRMPGCLLQAVANSRKSIAHGHRSEGGGHVKRACDVLGARVTSRLGCADAAFCRDMVLQWLAGGDGGDDEDRRGLVWAKCSDSAAGLRWRSCLTGSFGHALTSAFASTARMPQSMPPCVRMNWTPKARSRVHKTGA